MQPLQSNWFRGIPEAEKEEVEKIIRNSTIVLDQLTKHLEAEIRSMESAQTATSEFSDPNWPYRQADRNGAVRTLRNLLKMTNIGRTL
jgi:hypothetical protein